MSWCVGNGYWAVACWMGVSPVEWAWNVVNAWMWQVRLSGNFTSINGNTFFVQRIRTEILFVRPDYAAATYSHRIEI